jgi:hypothetical protein
VVSTTGEPDVPDVAGMALTLLGKPDHDVIFTVFGSVDLAIFQAGEDDCGLRRQLDAVKASTLALMVRFAPASVVSEVMLEMYGHELTLVRGGLDQPAPDVPPDMDPPESVEGFLHAVDVVDDTGRPSDERLLRQAAALERVVADLDRRVAVLERELGVSP